MYKYAQEMRNGWLVLQIKTFHSYYNHFGKFNMTPFDVEVDIAASTMKQADDGASTLQACAFNTKLLRNITFSRASHCE